MRGRHWNFCFVVVYVVALLLVAPVHAVRVSVAVPRVEDAVVVVTPELPGLTCGRFCAVQLVRSTWAIVIPITEPGGGEAGAPHRALHLVGLAGQRS